MRADPTAVRERRRGRYVGRLAALLERLREYYATQVELHERLALAEQPWREEVLHWSYDGREWHLHGHRLPADRERPRSVTSRGWCPGHHQASATDRP